MKLLVLLFLNQLNSYVSFRSISRIYRDRGSTGISHNLQEMKLDIPDLLLKSPVVDKKFFIETHGCQMNLADSDIVRSVLLETGYALCDVLEEADLILVNTCAIRENAEAKVWQRLKYFASLKKKKKSASSVQRNQIIVGVLGCMAEHLKLKLLNESGVDFIAGPDAYRSLPDLLRTVTTDQKAANVQLSLEETYADIQPVRLAEGNTHAFVTITRGCDNHCAFCIVPYTRGRERSRPVSSILDEICRLREQGIKEVVLLGQNVNSYHDRTTPPLHYTVNSGFAEGFSTIESRRKQKQSQYKENQLTEQQLQQQNLVASERSSSVPFKTSSLNSETANILLLKESVEEDDKVLGSQFGELLYRVAEIDREMRVRFQSPHPKDFPDEVLHLIAETPNICSSLHMPAQHGSSSVLDRMRRGYTRETYCSLVDRARDIIGGKEGSAGLGLSTDLISGFCGETEEEHQDTLSLLKDIGYDQAFTYAYSKREQTYAGLFYADDVPEAIKSRRLQELIETFQSNAMERNKRIEVGRLHLVLIEGEGKGSTAENKVWTGRTDTNKRVVFREWSSDMDREKKLPIGMRAQDVIGLLAASATANTAYRSLQISLPPPTVFNSKVLLTSQSTFKLEIQKGQYVIVQITEAKGHTLRGNPLAISSITEWNTIKPSNFII